VRRRVRETGCCAGRQNANPQSCNNSIEFNNIDRAFDSEVKILETIALKYDLATAKCTINLSS
jgi:hypothetical protein